MSDYSDLKVLPDIEKVSKATLDFFSSKYPNIPDRVLENRKKLKRYVEKFHKEAGTLTPEVKSKIDLLDEEKSYPFLMSAHQPNFIPYSGVVRKTTMLHVLDKKLEESTSNPNIEFFGIADQDISQSWKWQKISLLPCITKKYGYLSLSYDFPAEYNTKLFCSVPKPSQHSVAYWKGEIREWINECIRDIDKFDGKISREQKSRLYENYDEFAELLDESYKRSANFADFDAFLLSKIANNVWGYDTLFARFSECQQIFDSEFTFLLYRNEDYQKFLKDARLEVENKTTEETAPFWYHCDCKGKVGLSVHERGERISVDGACPACNKNTEFEFDKEELKNGNGLSAISSRISARARAMPLVLFNGLGVSCYVGGLGGSKNYSAESKIVADNLGLPFPPYAAWLPYDYYNGLGQLNTFLRIKSVCDGSEISFKKALNGLQNKIKKFEQDLEKKKHSFIERMKTGDKEALIKEIKKIDSNYKKEEISLKTCFSYLKKAPKILTMRPSIADYAINIGLRETNRQWVKHLAEDGRLTEDLYLDSVLGRNEEMFELFKDGSMLLY